MQINYYIYARKSSESEDRQVQSIEDQLLVLRKLALERNLKVIGEYVEAKSAKEPGRKKFNEMIDRILKGEASGIICWKLDRLFRNPIDFGQISWNLQKGIIQHIQCFDRSYYPDDNVLLMSVEQGMANQYIRDLSKSSKRGTERKAERGWYPAHAPLGYTHNPLKKKGDKEIIKDEGKFHLVRKMFDLLLSGTHTVAQIYREIVEKENLTSWYGTKFSKSGLPRIFTNPFYYGVFEYPQKSGKFYKGAHEPMITESEFEQVQKILNRRNNYKPETKTFTYSGLMKCGECGSAITAELKHKCFKNGRQVDYTYYHCTHKKNRACTQRKNIREHIVQEQIESSLQKLIIPQEFVKLALSEIEKDDENVQATIKAKYETIKRQISKKQTMLDGLLNLKLEGEISIEEFTNKKIEIESSKRELEKKLEEMNENMNSVTPLVKSFFNFGELAYDKFINGDDSTKKKIVAALGSNLSIYNEKLRIELEKPICYLEELHDSIRGLEEKKSRLEPAQVYIKKGTYEDFTPLSPSPLRG
jgi:DNA invertase Pin-like site-specific DNA recombinase